MLEQIKYTIKDVAELARTRREGGFDISEQVEQLKDLKMGFFNVSHSVIGNPARGLWEGQQGQGKWFNDLFDSLTEKIQFLYDYGVKDA